MKRVFTPAQATKTLPLVKKIVGEILEKGKATRLLLASTSGRENSEQLEQLQDEIDSLMKELEQIGCYYKDWDFTIGLVDFPSLIDAEAVFLCWRSDESELRWYHPMEEGYLGRKLIPEHLLSSSS